MRTFWLPNGKATGLAWCLALLLMSASALAGHTVFTVAGTYNTPGSSGDGGSAENALLRNPTGVVFDENDQLIISDFANARVRIVGTDGRIRAFAGTGVAGFSGDTGLAVDAQLRGPHAAALDAAGNVYIADFVDQRIRRVERSTGRISTFAGNGTTGTGGDGGLATSAQLNQPTAMVFDAAGNLYFTERASNRIRRVTPGAGGTISTYAGTGVAGFGGDGGPALNAQFDFPSALAFDAAGNLYVTDTNNNRVRRITPGGQISTFAGTGVASFSGDGGPATGAALNRPYGMRFDGSGTLFVATYIDARIRAITAGGLIQSIGGNGSLTPVPHAGDSFSGALDANFELAFDQKGRLWYPVTTGHVIRRIDFLAPGTRLWSDDITGSTQPYNIPLSTPNDDIGVAAHNVAVDSERYTYVVNGMRLLTGTNDSGNPILQGSLQWRLLKYALRGDDILNPVGTGWSQTYDSGFGEDQPYAVVLDPVENPVVVGAGRHSSGVRQWRVHKYARTDGSLLWASSLNTAVEATPYLAAIDTTGNIVVAGVISGAGGRDWQIVKYSGNGTELWQRVIVGSGDDTPYNLAIDPASRDIVVVGAMGAAPTGSAFASVRLAAASGSVSWQQNYDAPGSHVAYSVAFDADGSSLIAGEQRPDDEQARPRVEKRAVNGALLWAYVGAEDRSGARTIVRDASGDFFVGGHRYVLTPRPEQSNSSYWRAGNWMARLPTATGVPRWVTTFFAGGGDSFIHELKLGQDGHPVAYSRQLGYPIGNTFTGAQVGWGLDKRNADTGGSVWTKVEPELGPGTSGSGYFFEPGAFAFNGDSVVAAGIKRRPLGTSFEDPRQLTAVRFHNPNQQFIQFAALSDRVYAPAPFAVGPTGGNSGQPVLVRSLTPEICSASGSNGTQITMLTFGTCTLRASQAGIQNWRAAVPVDRSFAISSIAQSISFAPLADRDFAPDPITLSATGGASGNPVTFTALTLAICATSGVDGTTLTLLSAGTCVVRASQAGVAGYTAAPDVDRGFQIALVAQSIAFGALADRPWDPAPIILSATGGASGNPVQFASLTLSICSTSGSHGATLQMLTAGTCTVRASQDGTSGYGVAPNVDRSFAIALVGQAIQFGALPDRTFGDAPFQLSASGGASGNPVLFESLTTPTCTATGTHGSTITLVGAGFCTLRASQAGTPQYAAAAPQQRGFTIAQAAQVLNFDPLPDRTFGDPPITLAGTGGGSGNPVVFGSLTAGTCTTTGTHGTTLTLITGGTCTVRASQAGTANFVAAADVSRSFTIQRAAQSIQFGPQTPAANVLVPNGVFALSALATSSSGLPVNYTTTIVDPVVCTLFRSGADINVRMHNAGTCGVIAYQDGNNDYLPAATVTQTISITPATQVIQFGTAPTVAYAGTGTLLLSGGASGSPIVTSTTTPAFCSVSGTTVTGLATGTCTVAANQAGSANYLPAQEVRQDLQIVRAAQIIQFGAPPESVAVGGTATLSATGGGSGQPVVFTALTTAVCASSGHQGAVISGLSSGACIVAANQAGDSNHNAAPQATQSFDVGVQTIRFQAQTVYVGSPRQLVANGGPSGNPVVFSSTTPTVCTTTGADGATLTRLTEDACTIRATQSGGNGYLAASPVTVTSYNPERVPLSTSQAHSMVLRADGSLWVAGWNVAGQLGLGGTADRSALEQVGAAQSWTAVAAGGLHSAALRVDGTLWRWGEGSGLTPMLEASASNWMAVAASDIGLGALRADGSLWVWDTYLDTAAPVAGGPWRAISASASEFLLLHVDGSLWLLPRFERTPLLVDEGTDWRRIATSAFSGNNTPTRLALRLDGSLWAWGGNANGQVGDGSGNEYAAPTRIGTRTDWAAIAVGGGHTLVRRTDGSLWAAGDNALGQLGQGHLVPEATFVRVGLAADWTAIAAGINHSMGLRADGSLWSWGANPLGQLGDGTLAEYHVPMLALQAPQIGTAIAGPGSATVHFTPLASSFNAVTGYRAISIPDGIVGSCATPCNSVRVGGLSPGTSYRFQVAALHGAATGRDSNVSNQLTPQLPNVPGAPGIGTAVAADAAVQVAFTAPADDGGAAISSYTASCGSVSASGPVSPIVVTGLANGVAVTCTVAATNLRGTGPASAASNSVTPSANVATLSFNSQGGSAVGPISGSVGATVVLPGAPIRTGHTFAGWNTAANGSGTGYAAGASLSMPAGGLTLHAQWVINTYTLSYAAGAHGTLSGSGSQTVTFGGSGTAVTAVPDAGYHFVAWSDGSTSNPRTDTEVGAALSVVASFANAPPEIGAVADRSVLEDSGTQSILVAISDLESSAAALSLTAVSAQTGLIPSPLVTTTANAGERQLSFAPAANQSGGPVAITLNLTDSAGASSQRSFQIAVTPVNDAPVLTLGSLGTHVAGSSGPQSVSGFASVAFGAPDEQATQAVDDFLIDAVVDPAGILAAGSLDIANSGALAYTLTGVGGTASITVRVRDNGGTANGGIDTSAARPFTITVIPGTDLQVAIDNGRAGLLDGEVTVYAIVLANAGPHPVTGARLGDPLPATLVEGRWSCNPSLSTATCPTPSAGVGHLDVAVTLGVGQHLRFDVMATVRAKGQGSVSNTVSVVLPAGVTALNTANDTATDVDPILGNGVFVDGFEGVQQVLTVPAAAEALRAE